MRNKAFFLAFGVYFMFSSVLYPQSKEDSIRDVINRTEGKEKVEALIRLSELTQTLDPVEAIEFGEEAIHLSKELNNKELLAESYSQLGAVYRGLYEDDSILKYHSLALNLWKIIGDKARIGESLRLIAWAYMNEARYDTALHILEEAIRYFEEANLIDGKISSIGMLGNINWKLGNNRDAIHYTETALKLSREHNRMEHGILDLMGVIYINIGLDDIGMDYYFQAVRAYEKTYKPRTQLHAYLGIAYVLQRHGELESAKVYHQKYYDLISQYNIPDWMNNYNQCTARWYYLADDLETADSLAKEVLKYSRKKNRHIFVFHALELLGEIYEKKQEFNKAIDVAMEGIDLAVELSYYSWMNDFRNDLARYYYKIGEYHHAIKQARICLTQAYPVGEFDEMILAYQTLSMAYEDLHQYDSSLVNYKRYLAFKDSIISRETENKIEGLHIQYETEKKDREIELLNKDKALQEQRLEKQRLLRNGMITGILLIVLVGLLLFRSFRLRKKLEKQQAIIQERHRISADLHDDVGSGLSKITLLSELLKTQAKTPENRKEAEKISETALQLSSTISEIIWALNSNNDYLENMVAYIRRYAAEYFEDSPVNLKIVTSGEILPTPINGEHRRNIFYTVKEALNNILKHAEATEAELKFVVNNDKLDVIISDNGKGLPDGDLNRFGNGIKNMRARMKSIRGDFKIESHQGTRVILKLPI